LYRQVGPLLALENATGIDADQTVRVQFTAPVAHEAAGPGELAMKARKRPPPWAASMANAKWRA
jgi:hypothetical protein